MHPVIIATVISAIAFAVIYILAPAKYRPALKPFLGIYIAHRGLYNNDNGIPENSLPAFREAKKAGYGVELDVRLTGDGRLVVFHDADISRMCGEKIRISQASYTRLSQSRLNSSNEKIPLFSEALEALDGAPLVCEIKCDDVRDVEKVCRKTAKALKGYKGKYCIESFSPFVLRWFKKHEPKIVRGQLSRSYKGDTSVKGFWAFTMRHLMVNWIGRPDFIAYDFHDTHALGFNIVRLMRPGLIAWTVRSEDELTLAKKKFESFIFEGFIPKKQDAE